MTINWSRRKYTKQQFMEAWLSSISISEVASKLGANRSGSGFYTLRNAAIDLGLTQDHMPTSRTDRTARSKRKKRPLETILVENSTYESTSNLKTLLYKENIKIAKCEQCGIDQWQNKPAPLQLDHINGIRTDNRIENLRILCANCHAQTPTFAAKNKVKRL